MSTLSGIGNRNYVSGLVSGMDTEEMVEKMLSGTQAKIDKQTGYHCDDDFDSQNTDNSCDSNSRGYQNRKHFIGGGEKDCHQSTKRDDMPTIKP